MPALPLGELYDALRAHGFAIGVDDHIRIGQLLARDLAWTPDTLRVAIAALVVTEPDHRRTFDTCWERWLRSVEAPPLADLAPPPRAAPNHKARWSLAVIGALAIAVVVVFAMRGDHGTSPSAPPGGPLVPSAVPAAASPAVPLPPPSPPSSFAAIDLAHAGFALGTLIIAAATIARMLGARARGRFLPSPWRYALSVPAATRPVLPRTAIEDAAAELTWQTYEIGRDVDIARSVAATVRSGGFPTVVLRKPTRAPRYLVLQDTAGGAERWAFVYDELVRGLVREGVELERYTFAANPELCTGGDGRHVVLDDLLEHADAVIAIGDGAAAVNALTGEHAAWLGALAEFPHRLWLDPLPPARRTSGAQVIADRMPIEHGVAGALAALREAAPRQQRRVSAYPAVIERAPGTASASEALRAAIGERAFRLVAAVAITGPPTIAAARWLSETHALELDEHDWLGVATLPWFRTEQWPRGQRERLRSTLAEDESKLARAIAVTSERLYAASEPPHASGAHLAWRLEGALRASERGERASAAQTLNQIVRTPLAHEARGQLATLRMSDRGRGAFVAAMLLGAGLVGGAAGLDLLAAPPQATTIPASVTLPTEQAGTAPARKPPIAILGIEVHDSGGGIDPETVEAAKQITTWLRMSASNGPFVLVKHGEKELIDEKLLNNCDNEAVGCMVEIGTNLGVEALMYGRIDKVPRDGQTVFRVGLKVLNVTSKSLSNSTIEMVLPGDLTSVRGLDQASAWYRKLVAQ